MEPIHVPGPDNQAFNKNRRISDLIRAQVNHLKHIEQKLPAQLRQQIPQHAIVTEDDAARYIAPMTNLLRAQATTPSAQPIRSIKRPTLMRSTQGLALAASAEAGNEATASSGTRSSASKPSASNAKTAKATKGKK